MNIERDVRLMIFFDPNSSDSLEMVNTLNPDDEIPTVEVQRVSKFIPCIRDVPAVGVVMWASDLQGLVANVDDFRSYIESESAVKTSAHIAQRYLPDEEALKQPRTLVRTWEEVLAAEERLVKGDKILLGDQLYNVEQDTVPQSNYPPNGEGMLAIYRPIMPMHAGTLDDPIPFISGMDCAEGKYYSYNDSIYLCKGTMSPCTWTPDSGIWQWESVTE